MARDDDTTHDLSDADLLRGHTGTAINASVGFAAVILKDISNGFHSSPEAI